MQLHRLKLQNFRQHADTEIAFGPGITAIIGPNGAGKTTLLEGIAWAFYGNAAARGSRESIRWNRAPARSSVLADVEFALGSHDFRVVRTLYDAELYQDRFDAPVVRSHKEVSARVEQILGMTREEFFNTYFTGQKELAVMAAMGPTDRARFLSRVLGYERLRTAQMRLREVRSQLRGELSGLERGLTDATTLAEEKREAERRLDGARAVVEEAARARETAQQQLESEGPAWTRAVEVRESALALDGDRRVAERAVGEARREFERLDKELAQALAARTEFEKLQPALQAVSPLREELERLEREAHEAGRRRLLTGQVNELTAQEDRVMRRHAELELAEQNLAEAKQALDGARQTLKNAERAEEEARTAWVRDRQDAETKRQSLLELYLDHKRHRESVLDAGEDGECPVCKRPLGAVYQEALDTLARQMEEIEVKGKFFKQRIHQLQEAPAEVREASRKSREAADAVEQALQLVTQCESGVQEQQSIARELTRVGSRRRELEETIRQLPHTYDQERHDEVRKRLRELEPTIAQAAALEGRARQAESLVAEAERAERELSEREAAVKSLEAAIADLGYNEEQFVEARRRYEQAEAAAREAELQIVSAQGDLRAAETAFEAANRRLEERERVAAQISRTKREVQAHDELDRAYTHLRQELNARMRPELSERASMFLSALTDGRYHELELDENYQVMVLEDGQAKQVISGGEEDVTHLVLRLAISQMVAERAGQPLSLLVLDEIFGSLDEHRRQNVVQLLRGLADRFPQVVLITHIETVREGVDRVLRVGLDTRRGAADVSEDTGVGNSGVAA